MKGGHADLNLGIPAVLFTNANRYINKIDELMCILHDLTPDVIAVTETWLGCDVPDTVCQIDGYTLYRKDRTSGIGGGVLCLVADDIQSCLRVPQVACDVDFEMLWVLIRPRVLPRPLSCIIFGVLYMPPCYCVELQKN